MADYGVPRAAVTKTCPICGIKAFAATRKCKTEGCGWNYSLKVVDKDGSIAALNPSRKRTAADMLAGTTYIPTGNAVAAAASSGAAGLLSAGGLGGLTAQQRRQAAALEREKPQLATRTGNVTSYSNVSPEDDGNMDSCIICGDIGTLLCCDVCPLSYHSDCAGLTKIPQGFWSCPQCTAKNQAASAAGSAGVNGARSGGGVGLSSAPVDGGMGGASGIGGGMLVSGLGLQGGLDPFHQKLNACLDYSHSECVEVDGFTFQTFVPPTSLDPKQAAKEKAAKQQQQQQQQQQAAAAAAAATAAASAAPAAAAIPSTCPPSLPAAAPAASSQPAAAAPPAEPASGDAAGSSAMS